MKRLLPLGTALVLALTACGGSHKSASAVDEVGSTTSARSGHTIAAARRREAGRKAERLLRRVALPSGAVRLRRLPAGSSDVLLHSQLGVSTLTKFADRHAFWSVRAPLSSVDSFMKTHPPAGLKWGSSASDGGPGPTNLMEDFYGRASGGRPVQRLLSVAMARLGRRTVIRVDAGAAWVYPRSPREVVPSGVRSIDVTGGGVSRIVDDAAKVRRIVGWFDALNIVQPGQARVACPLSLASRVTFSFRSASKRELASALVPSQPADGCDPIEFTIGGHAQTPLIDSTPGQGKAFVRRVERLLGVRFSSRR